MSQPLLCSFTRKERVQHRILRSPHPPVKAIDTRAQASHSLLYSAGSSTQLRVLDAVKEAISKACQTISTQRRTASLVLLFINSTGQSHPADDPARVISVAKKSLATYAVLDANTQFFGATTDDHPGENPTAMVALVHLPPDTALRTFYIDPDAFNLDWTQQQWYNIIGRSPSETPQQTIMLLSHPDFEGAPDVLSSLDFAYPGVRKFGASAGLANALDNAFLFNSDGALPNGAIGLSIASPHVQIDVTVAQGARGVGPMLEVTEVKDGNEITRVKEVTTATESEGAPMTLIDLWAGTDAITQEDRELARKYLLMGIEVPKVVDLAFSSVSSAKGGKAMDITEERKQPVEMVIRKVIGFNNETKSLGVEGRDVRLGSRVQMQIRDETAARAELDALFNRLSLEGSSRMMDGMSLMGAIMLVDSERRENLYGDIAADTDRQLYAERFPVPLVMLTSNQQIGPLPAGGLVGAAGNSFTLSASALYVSIYGRTTDGQEEKKE